MVDYEEIKRKIRIENIVASTRIADELNLDVIAKSVDGAVYEPEQFPGLIYRLEEFKTAVLIFRSGKLNCTGAKNLETVRKTIYRVLEILRNIGMEVYDEPKITVQNIVSVFDLGQELNLAKIVKTFGPEHVEYEPEQFPGLVFSMDDPKVVLLLFGSGKVVCTGARKKEDIERAAEKIAKELVSKGLMQ